MGFHLKQKKNTAGITTMNLCCYKSTLKLVLIIPENSSFMLSQNRFYFKKNNDSIQSFQGIINHFCMLTTARERQGKICTDYTDNDNKSFSAPKYL